MRTGTHSRSACGILACAVSGPMPASPRSSSFLRGEADPGLLGLLAMKYAGVGRHRWSCVAALGCISVSERATTTIIQMDNVVEAVKKAPWFRRIAVAVSSPGWNLSCSWLTEVFEW